MQNRIRIDYEYNLNFLVSEKLGRYFTPISYAISYAVYTNHNFILPAVRIEKH